MVRVILLRIGTTNYIRLQRPMANHLTLPLRRSHRQPLRYHPLDEQAVTPEAPVYTVFDYNGLELNERKEISEEACRKYHKNGNITWINVDGLRKEDVERLCEHYEVHALVVEDILSRNERPKMEEIGDVIFCVLPQMFFNGNDDAQNN